MFVSYNKLFIYRHLKQNSRGKQNSREDQLSSLLKYTRVERWAPPVRRAHLSLYFSPVRKSATRSRK